jgi:hypothetical protein
VGWAGDWGFSLGYPTPAIENKKDFSLFDLLYGIFEILIIASNPAKENCP